MGTFTTADTRDVESLPNRRTHDLSVPQRGPPSPKVALE